MTNKASGQTAFNHYLRISQMIRDTAHMQTLCHWSHEKTRDKVSELRAHNSYKRLPSYYTGKAEAEISILLFRDYGQWDLFTWVHERPSDGFLIDTRNAPQDILPDRIHETICKENWRGMMVWTDTLPEQPPEKWHYASHKGAIRKHKAGEFMNPEGVKIWSTYTPKALHVQQNPPTPSPSLVTDRSVRFWPWAHLFNELCQHARRSDAL